MTPSLTNGQSPARSGASCLVVDDDGDVRRTLQRVLKGAGLACGEADSGRAALDYLGREGEVALMVSDINMPEMDGIELLREVKKLYPDTAVIMLTGVSEVDTAVECLRQGAMDYLAKPVLVEEVRARADQALEKRRLILENRFLQQSYQERLESQVRALDQKNKEQFLGQIQMAVRMLEKKDEYTRGHSSRVAAYAVKTAVRLGYTGPLLDEFRLGGELHDIGKIGTRDAVLNKPGKLTTEEFEEIKRHTVEGEEILEPLRREHPVVMQIVRWHHERMDGSGFPDGLVGEAIPEAARIVCVVDAFDAMTTTRSYRQHLTPARAMQELVHCAGPQFDPRVVEAFQAAHPKLM
ncbi:MAG TPA: HD domain-containing phosphohydrolase [Gemmatimonadales bacterium]|nr:HD domain-containing phosphohydrolase [Gemmatimonadales bacterium]